MLYMFINFSNCIMFIIVMVMSRNVISYSTCMFYFLCEMIIVIKIGKFIYFSYIGIIISVYGVMFLNNRIVNKIYNTSFLDLKLC